MAVTAKTKAKQKSALAATKAQAAPKTRGQDAIALLEADHRQVEDYFEAYEGLTDPAAKKSLADKICLALKVHTQIEEEFFYPPAREATGDGDLIDEAIVEHMGAKTLIAQIEAGAPDQPLYDAKVKVLGEQVRHHVEEEESELFPEVRASDLDLVALGAKLSARKAELMAQLAPPSAP
ncbi:hemerythrin [Caulobacter zeae]|uniref:Hemerythrin n=1 Tax=Caulobacter zeae TaxID=2055137 RepID=A0A2N5DRL3_9CAUL|nr:hemerythrin domain-containing protein [Caulobacter zeae]PLR28685.1 hemerythrin [Caulobacter zeae]